MKWSKRKIKKNNNNNNNNNHLTKQSWAWRKQSGQTHTIWQFCQCFWLKSQILETKKNKFKGNNENQAWDKH